MISEQGLLHNIHEPSFYLAASTATFSRFIPIVKTRFDYGVSVFILTFSLVSVSGYRVEELFMLARYRLSTIAIGVSLCMLISMLIWPVWAGEDLHHLITRNMEKLACSLDGMHFTDCSIPSTYYIYAQIYRIDGKLEDIYISLIVMITYSTEEVFNFLFLLLKSRMYIRVFQRFREQRWRGRTMSKPPRLQVCA